MNGPTYTDPPPRYPSFGFIPIALCFVPFWKNAEQPKSAQPHQGAAYVLLFFCFFNQPACFSPYPERDPTWNLQTVLLRSSPLFPRSSLPASNTRSVPQPTRPPIRRQCILPSLRLLPGGIAPRLPDHDSNITLFLQTQFFDLCGFVKSESFPALGPWHSRSSERITPRARMWPPHPHLQKERGKLVIS